MDPRIVPVSSLGPSILAALQAQQGEAQLQALLALVGQNLELMLVTSEAGTSQLQLPSGQVFEAEGELPFPPGTRLTVQVQPPTVDQAAPRLKLLEALPPPPVPILAPLQQGEASQLLARLQAPEPPPGLEPLVRLFAQLEGGAKQSAPLPVATADPVSIPPRLLEALQELPPAVLRILQQKLVPQSLSAPPSLPELAKALEFLLQNPAQIPTPAQGGEPSPPAVGPKPVQGSGPAPTQATATRPAAPAPAAAAPPEPAADLPATLQGRSPRGVALPPPTIDIAEPSPESLPSSAPPLPVPALLTTFPAVSLLNGDPALEPLKNLLLLLLRPASSTPEERPALSERPALADLLARATGDPRKDSPAPPQALEARPNAPTLLAPGSILEGRIRASTESVKPTLLPEPSDQAGPRLAPENSPGLPSTPASTPRPEPATRMTPGPPPAPAAAPESWETWMTAAVKALSDPRVSPREAPFHLAQAREGTAFFELPLPWDGSNKVLQMWVEADGGARSRGTSEPATRVLVGLQFSALGETRVGLLKHGNRLQVRVWVENSELLKAQEDVLRSELSELGPGLDFQVLPLGKPGETVPSLRSLAGGTSFHALG